MKNNIAQKNIPQGWEIETLSNLAHIKKGEQLNRLNMIDNGKYPALNGGISPSGYTDKWNTEANAITISEGGNSCGYINFTKEKFWCGGHCYALLNLKENVDMNFLYQALKSKQDMIMKLRVGSGLPNIQKRGLEEFALLIPKSKIEQQKIAQILGAVDEDIVKTQGVIEAAEKLKKGLMQQLFTRGISDGIKELKLEDIAKVTSSKRIMRSEYVAGGVPFYRSKEIIEKSKGKKHSSVFYISEERFNEIERRFGAPHIGDILITAVGTIGVVYLVDEDKFYFKDGNLLWIKDILDSLDRSYLKHYMNSEIFQRRVLGTAIGSNQKALTIEKVEKVLVPIPTLSEQRKIAEIISAVDEKISINKKLKNKLTLLKKGLMQDLLSGKVRVGI